jgi:hypothetical protein
MGTGNGLLLPPPPQQILEPPGKEINNGLPADTIIHTIEGSIYAFFLINGKLVNKISGDGVTWTDTNSFFDIDNIRSFSIITIPEHTHTMMGGTNTRKKSIAILYQKIDNDIMIDVKYIEGGGQWQDWVNLGVIGSSLGSGWSGDYDALPTLKYGAIPGVDSNGTEIVTHTLFAVYKNNNGELVFIDSKQCAGIWSLEAIIEDLGNLKLVSLSATVDTSETGTAFPLYVAYTAVTTNPTTDDINRDVSNDKVMLVRCGGGGGIEPKQLLGQSTGLDTDYLFGQVDITIALDGHSMVIYAGINMMTKVAASGSDPIKYIYKTNVQEIDTSAFTVSFNESKDIGLNYLSDNEHVYYALAEDQDNTSSRSNWVDKSMELQYSNTWSISTIVSNNKLFVLSNIPSISLPKDTDGLYLNQLVYMTINDSTTDLQRIVYKGSGSGKNNDRPTPPPADYGYPFDKNLMRTTSAIESDNTLYMFYLSTRYDTSAKNKTFSLSYKDDLLDMVFQDYDRASYSSKYYI